MRASYPWQELVKVALMGTHRQALNSGAMLSPSQNSIDHPLSSEDASHRQIQALLTQLDWTEPETAILDAAGAIALHTQVGNEPQTSPQTSPQRPNDPTTQRPNDPTTQRPLCSPQTTKHLRHGLRHDPDFCTEVLTWLMAYRQRAPEECLPSLLDFGLQYPQWQSLIIQAIGERGRWLACQNPDWEYGQWNWSLLPEDLPSNLPSDLSNNGPSDRPSNVPDDSLFPPQQKMTSANVDALLPQDLLMLWRRGTIASRLELLQRWRSVAPNAARTLLEETWRQESAKHKAILLPALSIGLSLADEPFLDQALSARSSTIRTIATQLLACLPQSQWGKKMTEWGRSLFTIMPSPLLLQVNLPTTNDPRNPSQSTSNLLPLNPHQTSSALQNSQQLSTNVGAIDILVQVTGSIALEYWDEYGSPSELIQALSHQQHGSVVFQGWALAAIRQQNSQWASALLRSAMINGLMLNRNNGANEWKDHYALVTDILYILAYPQREEIVAQWVPSTTRQQMSLLSSPGSVNNPSVSSIVSSAINEQGAANGLAMVRWLKWAVAICDNPLRLGWSLDFSQLVLNQLQRQISDQMQPYIRELRKLARAIASRLDPILHDDPIFSALAERTIAGSSHLERSWEQSIDIIRSTLAMRQAMQASFLE